MLHRLSRKGQEHGVAWSEELEVVILEDDRERWQVSYEAPG